MNKELIDQAEAELAGIEQKLAAVAPLHQRRDQLRTWIQLTRQVYPNLAPTAERAPDLAPQFAPGASHPSRLITQKKRVAAAAAEIILAEGPMLSRQLVERLKARGVDVGGADPASGVSSILSRNDMFKSDRAAGGWVLVQSHKEVTPPGAPTPAWS